MLDFVETIDSEINQIIKVHASMLQLKQELKAHLERVGSTVDYRMLWDIVNHRSDFPIGVTSEDFDIIGDLYITLCIMAHDCDGDMTHQGFTDYRELDYSNLD